VADCIGGRPLAPSRAQSGVYCGAAGQFARYTVIKAETGWATDVVPVAIPKIRMSVSLFWTSGGEPRTSTLKPLAEGFWLKLERVDGP
jgi:hypothetical protein